MKLHHPTLKAARGSVPGLARILGVARLLLEDPAEAAVHSGNPLFAQGGGYSASWLSHLLGLFVLVLGVYVFVFVGSAIAARIKDFVRSAWRRR